jgi:hypothetical protein
MLYKPAPFPTNDDEITDAVIGPLKLTLKDVSHIDPVNANKLSPEDPDVPDDPLDPDVPLVPAVPLDPDVPDVPSLPDEPDVPLVPAVPEEPDEPDVPEEPSLPEEPDVPDVPDVPADPDVPDEPLDPDVPDVPAVPEEPDVPDEPLPPIVAITVPVCAVLKYTFKLLLSITSISVGITTLSLLSNTLIAGYLYPKLWLNDHVVDADDTLNVLV